MVTLKDIVTILLFSKRNIFEIMAEETKNEEQAFVEFRRKVRAAEMLSAAMERLLQALGFTGRLTVVVQNGRVLKSGYEEGYFSQRTRLGEGL